jgi:hypothetical protein
MNEEANGRTLFKKLEPLTLKMYGALGRIIVLLFIGISIGLYIGYKIHSHNMGEIVKMGRMLYQERVYDVMLSEKMK